MFIDFPSYPGGVSGGAFISQGLRIWRHSSFDSRPESTHAPKPKNVLSTVRFVRRLTRPLSSEKEEHQATPDPYRISGLSPHKDSDACCSFRFVHGNPSLHQAQDRYREP